MRHTILFVVFLAGCGSDPRTRLQKELPDTFTITFFEPPKGDAGGGVHYNLHHEKMDVSVYQIHSGPRSSVSMHASVLGVYRFDIKYDGDGNVDSREFESKTIVGRDADALKDLVESRLRGVYAAHRRVFR